MPRVPQPGRNWLQEWKDASYIAREAARERAEREPPPPSPEPVDEPDLLIQPTRREPPSRRARMVAAALDIELPADQLPSEAGLDPMDEPESSDVEA